MSQRTATAPNPTVSALYERLGELLEEGDDVFVDRGPGLLQAAIDAPEFFEGVETERASPGEYTRRKVVGEEGRHVVRFMEWPPGYALPPHEHHGRPCFEVLVDGLLSVVDVEPEPIGDDRYALSVRGTKITEPGETAVVDPRENEVHAVYSPVRSRSLHVYPEDNAEAYGYVLRKDDLERDVYARERFQLDAD